MNIPFSKQERDALATLAKPRRMSPEEFVRALALEAISPPTVTLKMVASVARVSPMAASYAFNGVASEVSEKTIRHVRAVAKKMGYRPGLTAQSLRLKRSHS